MPNETKKEEEEPTQTPPKAESQSAVETAQEVPAEPKKRIRRTRKRTRFSIPQHPPQSVKSLWNQANQVDQERAHKYGIAILETWLGKKSRQEAADELGMPVLRIWQLSQQAVSGMLAGLLTQPRTRRSKKMPVLPPEDDPKILKKTIEKLEKELEIAHELIEVLKLLPNQQIPPMEKYESMRPQKKKAAEKKRK